MEISVDEAHPEDSIDRYAITVHCTGEEAFIVPSHWHKVSIGIGGRANWAEISGR